MYGVPGKGKSGTLSLSVGNNIEMKKKVKILFEFFWDIAPYTIPIIEKALFAIKFFWRP